MPGLVPGIHVFLWSGGKDVDARDISASTRVFRRAMRGHEGRESDSNQLQMTRLERAKGIEPSTYSLGNSWYPGPEAARAGNSACKSFESRIDTQSLRPWEVTERHSESSHWLPRIEGDKP
jgi:hypothetical protein